MAPQSGEKFNFVQRIFRLPFTHSATAEESAQAYMETLPGHTVSAQMANTARSVFRIFSDPVVDMYDAGKRGLALGASAPAIAVSVPTRVAENTLHGVGHMLAKVSHMGDRFRESIAKVMGADKNVSFKHEG